jgi:hypothetical protein
VNSGTIWGRFVEKLEVENLVLLSL